MRSRFALLAAAVTVVVAGCGVPSEISTLQPVAGDQITGLNIAVNDVLVEHKVDIKVAPVCTFDGSAYACDGSTLTGELIKGSAQGAEAETMTVTVGGKTLYDGPIAEVYTKAGSQ